MNPLPKSPYRLTPSRLGHAFQHTCDRQLKLSLSADSDLIDPWLSLKKAPETRTQSAIFQAGYQWEEQVITLLQEQGMALSFPAGEGPLTNRKESFEESIKRLQLAEQGQYLYQLTLTPPKELYSDLGLNPEEVELRTNYPDLIYVDQDAEGNRCFKVIDIKRSKKLKISHRIQVCFYALELQALLPLYEIKGSVDLFTGGVWLGETEEPTWFSLSATTPFLLKQTRRLSTLYTQNFEETQWHLNPHCEWCVFQPECHRLTLESNHISRLMGLSSFALKALQTHLDVETLPELDQALNQEGVDQILAKSASLSGKRTRLQNRLEAYKTGLPFSLNTLSSSLPKSEDVAIFLTAQTEPVSYHHWALGFYVRCRPDLTDQISIPSEPQVYCAESSDLVSW